MSRTSRTSPVHPYRRLALALSLHVLAAAYPGTGTAQQPYFPGAEWERRSPEQVGMNADRLLQAIGSATEWNQPRDLLEMHSLTFGREPMGEAIGPLTVRGPATGVVIRRGYIVAEWGDPWRVEPTYSVTKSFLSSTVGLAYDRGLIRSVEDPVRDYFPPVMALRSPPGPDAALVASARAEPRPQARAAASGDPSAPSALQVDCAPRSVDRTNAIVAPPRCSAESDFAPTAGARAAFDAFELIQPFEDERNARITWDHLLRQTSDWEGTLWGKPDWVDRPGSDLEAHRNRVRNEPGTRWTYNDVRVNLLALAALNVWRRPLPEVLKEHLMDPIGASNSWRWFGYDNSWVVMDGKLVQSVSGGAHWGGGMWINAYDMARFGLLTLHRGRWQDRQVLSDEWVRMSLTATPVQRTYGFMNWYVTPGASEFRHSGTGNTIYVYPEHDLVVVTRWVGNAGRLLPAIIASIER